MSRTSAQLNCKKVNAQSLDSPCPELLQIDEASFDVGTWGGILQLQLDKENVGLFIEVKLDSKINLITNNISVITTRDNQIFLLENFLIETPSPFFMAFSVKYNGAAALPQVEHIYINGRLECPKNFNIGGKAKPKKVIQQMDSQEDAVFVDVDEPNTEVPKLVEMQPKLTEKPPERATIPFIDINDDD